MDLFKVLGSGARFNKKRFIEDIALFEVFLCQFDLRVLMNYINIQF
jgi:hypothetical protein